MTTSSPLLHRGRWQAQEEKETLAQAPWVRTASEGALPAATGRALLESVHGQLTKAEQDKRELGFQEARAFIEIARMSGGLNADQGVVKKSFPRKKLQKGVRVDVDVFAGSAFV